MRHLKHIFIGIIGGVSLLILYFVILTLANSFSHVLQQFSQLWYWILILAAGFGVQVGFYSCIREKQKAVSGKVLAASGGVSTGSMVVCCLHHLVDVLPIMGLAAVSLFLVQYQINFIILGILSNIVGIIIMLEIIKKHQYLGLIKKIAIGASLVLFLASFFFLNNRAENETINLSAKIDNQGGIAFEAKPIDFTLDNQIKFEITIDTHAGSLDFDLAKISILEDDNGQQYYPLKWSGGTGSHHLSGILTFPALKDQTKNIKLVIQDNFLRIFEWDFTF